MFVTLSNIRNLKYNPRYSCLLRRPARLDSPEYAGRILVMAKEIWKDVPGFPGYKASNKGRIKSRIRLFVGGINSYGYRATTMNYRYVKAHRIIAITFIPNPKNKPEVNHINGIKTDNRVENLEWVTTKENMQHSWKMGRKAIKGEEHANSKLNKKSVIEIRLMNKLGFSCKQLSEIYSVSKRTIQAVTSRRTWKHVK